MPLTQLYLHLSGRTETNAAAIIILRIWKIIRAMHAIAHSVQLKLHSRNGLRRRRNCDEVSESDGTENGDEEDQGECPDFEGIIEELERVIQGMEVALAKEEGGVKEAVDRAIAIAERDTISSNTITQTAKPHITTATAITQTPNPSTTTTTTTITAALSSRRQARRQ
ncbi:hypothetical protein HDU67_000501 [Dinochytrium kinnereticum]|nr:hypothetical protein HDU67_000501 [Dinochytrium kinnereticum]